MSNIKTLLVAAVVVLGATSASQGAVDETRIRQSKQNSVVYGFWPDNVRFTTTGYLGDRVQIFDAYGHKVVGGTIGSLRSSPYVRGVVSHSGGQTSLRFEMPPAIELNGGDVFIKRNGVLIDHDPIVLIF